MEFNNVCMLSNVKQNEYISEDVFPKMNTLVQYFIAMCSSRMYPHPPQGTFTKIPRGRGVSKSKLLKESMRLNQNFRGVGREFKLKTSSWDWYGYLLEQHNGLVCQASCISVYFQQTCKLLTHLSIKNAKTNQSKIWFIYYVQELPVWSQGFHFNTYIQLNQIFKDSFHIFLYKKNNSNKKTWFMDKLL